MIKVLVRTNPQEFIRRGFDPGLPQDTIDVDIGVLDAEERRLLASAIEGGPHVFSVRSLVDGQLLMVDEPTPQGIIVAIRRDMIELGAAVDRVAAAIGATPGALRALAERLSAERFSASTTPDQAGTTPDRAAEAAGGPDQGVTA